MSAPIPIANRRVVQAEEEATAQLYLRNFDPKRYAGYYRRLYDPDAYLDAIGIDKIAELIEHGNGVLNVAEVLDISGTTLRRWLNFDKTRLSKIRDAHIFAGNAYAYKAERVLMQSQHGTKEQIAWASKMAEHYRWMATKLDREIFGEVKDSSDAKAKAPLTINWNLSGSQEQQEKIVKQTSALTADFMRLTDETEQQ